MQNIIRRGTSKGNGINYTAPARDAQCIIFSKIRDSFEKTPYDEMILIDAFLGYMTVSVAVAVEESLKK